MPPLGFPPQHLVYVLFLVGQIACVRRIHLRRRRLIPAVLLGEDVGLGSDSPVITVIRACRSFLEMINKSEVHSSLPETNQPPAANQKPINFFSIVITFGFSLYLAVRPCRTLYKYLKTFNPIKILRKLDETLKT